MKCLIRGVAAAVSMACAWADAALAQPAGDFHQHLFSPTAAALVNVRSIDAQELIAMLDAADYIRDYAAFLEAVRGSADGSV